MIATTSTKLDCDIYNNGKNINVTTNTANLPFMGPKSWLIGTAPREIPTDILQVRNDYMSSMRFIIVSFLDASYIDIGLNFYHSSIMKHSITNFMFVSQSREACNILSSQNILCVLYDENDSNLENVEYGSDKFRQRMNVRASMLLELLDHDVSVLLTDSDMIYFKDPRDYLISRCSDADICALQDGTDTLNAGFILLKSTSNTLKMMRKRLELTRGSNAPTDQKAFNEAIKMIAHINIVRLPLDLFMNGQEYFVNQGHYFARKTEKDIFVVHNNHIVSRQAKIYRFRENMLWFYDEDFYYSDVQAKYLIYDNPDVGFWYSQNKMERNALENALAIGKILNRIVILPTFHCPNNLKTDINKKCPLHTNYNIIDLESIFHNRYREHVFLENIKVPESVSKSKSSRYFIMSNDSSRMKLYISSEVVVLSSNHDYITENDIKDWFSPLNDVSVLQFHSLYYAFGRFAENSEDLMHRCKIQEAIQNDGPRQLKYYKKTMNKN